MAARTGTEFKRAGYRKTSLASPPGAPMTRDVQPRLPRLMSRSGTASQANQYHWHCPCQVSITAAVWHFPPRLRVTALGDGLAAA